MGIIVSFFVARFVYLLGSDKTSSHLDLHAQMISIITARNLTEEVLNVVGTAVVLNFSNRLREISIEATKACDWLFW
jgi:hypothetical protein